MRDKIERALEEATTLLGDIPHKGIELLTSMLVQTYKRGGNVFICGNGGSHADALHFAEELTGRFRKDRRPLGALALGEACHTTCVSNDYSFVDIFSRQLEALARAGDSLIVLSTSGKSANIVNAGRWASIRGINAFALLGKGGGEVASTITDNIIIPSQSTDRIQEMHMMILHIAIEMMERELFPENYTK